VRNRTVPETSRDYIDVAVLDVQQYAAIIFVFITTVDVTDDVIHKTIVKTFVLFIWPLLPLSLAAQIAGILTNSASQIETAILFWGLVMHILVTIMHSSIHSLTYSVSQSLTRSLIQSVIHSLIDSLIDSLVH